MPLATFAAGGARRDPRHDDLGAVRPAGGAGLGGRRRRRREAVTEAVAGAVATASRFAAALGPGGRAAARLLARAVPRDLCRRIPGRGGRARRPDRRSRSAALRRLPAARLGARQGSRFASRAIASCPTSPTGSARAILAAWARVRRWGKPLNVVRLVKAAFTFDGAGRYAAWKIERHTGVPVPLTPWQERHPILAAPGVLWRVRRGASGDAIATLILAGSRPGAPDPVAAAEGVAHKALARSAAQTLLARVAGGVQRPGRGVGQRPGGHRGSRRLGLEVLPPAAGPVGQCRRRADGARHAAGRHDRRPCAAPARMDRGVGRRHARRAPTSRSCWPSGRGSRPMRRRAAGPG